MRLALLRIQNLRTFADVTVPFEGYTCLVGANGSGKSTVLTALNIFFRETANSTTDCLTLDREDFFCGNTAEPIQITATFDGLSAEAQTDFTAYYRSEKLIIKAVARWDEGRECAEVKQYGERIGIKDFERFLQAHRDNQPVRSVLRPVYEELRARYADLPDWSNAGAAVAALEQYADTHANLCEVIPSETKFYGWAGLIYLQKYIQWVYIPAVKEASSEQGENRQSCLSKLVERTVQNRSSFERDIASISTALQSEYDKMIQDNQKHLEPLSDSLGKRFKQWAHQDVSVRIEYRGSEKPMQVVKPTAFLSAGEGHFVGSVSRFGHGLQRSFLLAILQELAVSEVGGLSGLLLGIEEPELYQHPPQARYLASTLFDLALKKTQVVISTHSPLFVSGANFETVRLVHRRQSGLGSTVRWINTEKLTEALRDVPKFSLDHPGSTRAKLSQALQPSVSEMFFSPLVIFVEGLEDVAYLTSTLAITGKLDQFRSFGAHIVQVSGKSNLLQPIVIARQLGIPHFVVFDSDAHDSNAKNRSKHQKDNLAVLTLCGHAAEDPLPVDNIWKPNLVMWRSEMGKVVSEEFGDKRCREIRDKVKAKYGMQGRGSLNKNSLLIGYVLAEAFESGHRSESLEALASTIMDWAKAERTNPNSAQVPRRAVNS